MYTEMCDLKTQHGKFLLLPSDSKYYYFDARRWPASGGWDISRLRKEVRGARVMAEATRLEYLLGISNYDAQGRAAKFIDAAGHPGRSKAAPPSKLGDRPSSAHRFHEDLEHQARTIISLPAYRGEAKRAGVMSHIKPYVYVPPLEPNPPEVSATLLSRLALPPPVISAAPPPPQLADPLDPTVDQAMKTLESLPHASLRHLAPRLEALLAAARLADNMHAQAARAVAKVMDVADGPLESVFEHCGLSALGTLKLVNRAWAQLALTAAGRWKEVSWSDQRFGKSIPHTVRWGINPLGHAVQHTGLYEPHAVLTLPFGDIAVADRKANVVRIFSATGEESTVLGNWRGANAHEDVGPSAFNWPQGLATDGSYLYVAEGFAHCVKQFSLPDYSYVSSLRDNSHDYSRIGGTALLHSPSGMAVAYDMPGWEPTLFVANKETSHIAILGTHPLRSLGSLGNGLPRTNFGPFPFGPKRFDAPSGLAAHRGELYIANEGLHCIQVLNLQGVHLRSFGEKGHKPGQFDSPTAVAICRDRVVVSERYQDRVQLLTRWGSPLQVLSTSTVVDLSVNQQDEILVCCDGESRGRCRFNGYHICQLVWRE